MSYPGVKIFFLIEQDPDGYPPVTCESLWAVPHEGGFRLDNIPFFVKGVSSDDVVEAALGTDGELWFRGVRARGGHSTLRVLIEDEADVGRWRITLQQLGCSSEQDAIPNLIAVDMPPEVHFPRVWSVLSGAESEGALDVEEACLQHVTE